MNDVGYSGTPLVRKLGIKADHLIAVVGAPADFDETLGPLPSGVTAHKALDATSRYDVVLSFLTTRAALTESIAAVRPLMAPACGFWVAWPKRASGVPTELTDNVVREIALPTGLVDNKVCAIDATWSGLRLVIRVELR